MKATRRLVLASIAGMAMIAAAPQAFSQQKGLQKQLIGGWTLVSASNERDGKKVEQFGANPKGYMTFGEDGRFSYIVFRPGSPKIAANDRQKVTPTEAQAIVQNSIAYYGTYKLNEKDGSLEVNIEQSTFPNNIGQGKRMVKVAGDELTLTNPGPTAGGINRFVWKRAK
jgi:lipocalin-like protein